MNLNDEHIALLTRVRERMVKDVDEGTDTLRPFICWNIMFVQLGIWNLPRNKLFNELVEEAANDLERELIAAIHGAIDENETFCNWLMDEGDRVGLTANVRIAEVMGRLAWLDKMIETRVIA